MTDEVAQSQPSEFGICACVIGGLQFQDKTNDEEAKTMNENENKNKNKKNYNNKTNNDANIER